MSTVLPEVEIRQAEVAVRRPLGLGHWVEATDAQLARLTALEHYDLWFVEERLAKKRSVPEGLIDEAIFEFKRYMALIAMGHRGVTMMSPEVDEVWHALILFTREYAEFCSAVFGEFIHHVPYTSRSAPRPEDRPRFVDLYRRYFSELNPKLYGHFFVSTENCDDTGSCGGGG